MCSFDFWPFPMYGNFLTFSIYGNFCQLFTIFHVWQLLTFSTYGNFWPFSMYGNFWESGKWGIEPFHLFVPTFFPQTFSRLYLFGFASSLSFFMDAFNQMDNSVQFRNQINSLVFLKERWGRRGGNNLNVEINSSAISWFCKFSQFLSSLWRWFPVGTTNVFRFFLLSSVDTTKKYFCHFPINTFSRLKKILLPLPQKTVATTPIKILKISI